VKRAALAAVLAVLLAAGGIASYVLYKRSQGADVRGSATVEFATTDVPTPPPPPPPRRHGGRQIAVVSWGTYGFDARRLRFDPAVTLRPPFERI
jgi:hypothetical protein